MVTAIILMKIERGKVSTVAQSLIPIQGVVEVLSVGGRYDIVTMIKVPNNEALSDLVNDNIAAIEHVESTETMISYRTYANNEMEATFEVGY